MNGLNNQKEMLVVTKALTFEERERRLIDMLKTIEYVEVPFSAEGSKGIRAVESKTTRTGTGGSSPAPA